MGNTHVACSSQIYRWAYRFLQNHDDALDVTQGVLVRQLRAGKFDADGQWGWLRRVVVDQDDATTIDLKEFLSLKLELESPNR